jgi:predicted dehydrogenase
MISIYDTAIVGNGYWGSIIAFKLTKLTKKKIIIYDKDIKKSQFLSNKIKNKFVIEKKFNNLLRNKKIKNIILATSPKINFEISKKIINAKKNLFIEKPMVSSSYQLKILDRLAKKNKRIIMGGYIYLFNPFIKKIKNIVDSNILGKIKYIYMSRKNLGPVRNSVDSSDDLSSHDLSILKFLFPNSSFTNIKKFKNNLLKKNISDISDIKLCIKNIKCDLSSSWLHPYKERKIIIIAKKKMLVFDELANDKIVIFNKYAEYPKIQKFNKNIFSNIARVHEGVSKIIKVNFYDSLENELKYFIKCSAKSIEPITSCKFGIKILDLLKKN